MIDRTCANSECRDTIEDLRARLDEAEETLRAIRSGEVDALVVAGPQGNQIFTLKGAESTYRVLVEAMNEGALILTSDGTVMYSNNAFADMVDIPLEQVIGSRIHRFVREHDIGAVDELLEKGLHTDTKRELELKNKSKDELVPAQVSVSRLPTESEGISAVVTDLTEHKRTEAELQTYREHLEELIVERTNQLQETMEKLRQRAEEVEVLMDSTPVAIWIAHDPQCNHITGNRIANEFYEADERENVSANVSPIRRFFRDGRELRPDELPMQYAAAHNMEVRDSEFEVITPSGTRKILLGQASPLRDVNGQVRGAIAAFVDITERKRAEGMLAATKDLLEHQVHLLQRALIPAKPQVIEGYSIASAYIPAYEGTEIGGDFMDVFQTEDGKVGILIGDVSGKGIESAALAATTRSTVRAFAYDSSSPGDALSHANSLLTAQQVDYMQFVTSYLVILDPITGDIKYSSAGHPPGIITGNNKDMVMLCSFNMPLGIQGGIKYEECNYKLKPGDKLILYTDGITEARHDHALFGTEGIENVLSLHGHVNPGELVEAILASVKDWAHGKLRDDTAILIISRNN
ncbi:MAG: PP2C family protein-serine/threonine phosphatase [Armatimonadota bacterium]